MVVYLDFPRKDGYSHLISDTIPNLHEFAKSIDVKRCWFENKRGKKRPHYDIKGEAINKAIELGAIQVSSKEIIKLLKKYYS